MSTISILPHLVHSLRVRKPNGAPFAWCFGAFSSGLWFVYGFAIGDIWVAAPGFVTIPVGLGLATWCVLHRRSDAAPAAVPVAEAVVERETTPVFMPGWDAEALVARAGDTMEMPRIVA